MKNKEQLNQHDFIESVILKVRKHEKRQKQVKAMTFSTAFFGVIFFSAYFFVSPRINKQQLSDQMNDDISNALLNQNLMNDGYSLNYAFNAGKMEQCLKYLKCDDG